MINLFFKFREVYLPEVIEHGLIEDDRALGIAHKIISEGITDLSDKQWHVFLKHGVGEINYIDK